MVHLSDLFALNTLEKHLESGYVRAQTHPTYPLTILNYGPMVQYERAWDEVTTQTRGLIYNHDTLEVVARPWEKFHNWDDSQVVIPPGPVIRSPKYDGSMGILYALPAANRPRAPFDPSWRIASRGSFTSEQAKKGSSMFLPTALQCGFAPKQGFTYLFEILYPENRIVVDYHGFSGLVLLDVLDTTNGLIDVHEFDDCHWPHKAEKSLLPSFYDTMASDIGENEEGFVLYWVHTGTRAKVKGAPYLRLQQLITGCSARTIWESVSRGDDIDGLLEDVPDEFFDFVKSTQQNLAEQFAEIETVSRQNFFQYTEDHGMPKPERRKDFALWLTQYEIPYQPVMWKLWDDCPFDDIIWKLIKPAATKPFWNLSEDVAGCTL